eukprot:1158952-Pelagomonas_calceolata.AAC.2
MPDLGNKTRNNTPSRSTPHLPGKHCRGVARNGGGGVVLGAEDVAGAPADLGTQGSQGLNQHGSLDGHVEGAHDLGALQGLGGAELRAAGHQAGHLSLSQVDLQAAEVLRASRQFKNSVPARQVEVQSTSPLPYKSNPQEGDASFVYHVSVMMRAEAQD